MKENSIDKLSRTLVSTLRKDLKEKRTQYDTQAHVLRIDGDIAWVHIPGGVEETPVRRTVNANPGDTVQVRVANGKAWILGNATNPPTDDARANIAFNYANNANEKADIAVEDAEQAKSEAGRAYLYAEEAHDYAELAETYAEEAHDFAEQAMGDASDAKTAANEAKTAATEANTYARGALTSAATVQSVVDTVSWLAEHAAVTDDATVDPDKNYYKKNQDGTYVLVDNPIGNPHAQGLYEMDDAVSNYVAAHLALATHGLELVLDESSYRIHIGTHPVTGQSGTDGVYIIDQYGNVVSYFGDSIRFSSSTPQYIGGEDAYIIFNPTTGGITIGGTKVDINANVTIGGRSRSLSQLITDMQAEIDGAIESWYYAVDPTLNNPPAVDWDTNDKRQQHLRDLYFNTTNGHSFRWALENGEYKWIQIEDTDLATLANDLATNYVTKEHTVTDVAIEYALGDDADHAPQSGWSPSTPEWTVGKFVWQKTTKVINGTNHITYACIQGAKGETGATGADGEDAVVLRIDSSRGTVFKNNAVSTVLKVTIYSGEAIITNITSLRNKFGAGAYLQWYWQRLDDSDYGIIVATDHKLSDNGFTLTLTPEDVDVKVTFRCELII